MVASCLSAATMTSRAVPWSVNFQIPRNYSVTSGLAEAARGAFSATASKGLETLNENLQNRTAALREEGGSEEQPAESEDATESDEAESQETEESEDSEQVAEDEATESGGR